MTAQTLNRSGGLDLDQDLTPAHAVPLTLLIMSPQGVTTHQLPNTSDPHALEPTQAGIPLPGHWHETGEALAFAQRHHDHVEIVRDYGLRCDAYGHLWRAAAAESDASVGYTYRGIALRMVRIGNATLAWDWARRHAAYSVTVKANGKRLLAIETATVSRLIAAYWAHELRKVQGLPHVTAQPTESAPS